MKRIKVYHSKKKSSNQRERRKEENRKTTKQTVSNQENGNSKSLSINNYSKYKWIKLSNQKMEWWNGLKNKILLRTVNKRSISDLRIYNIGQK